MAAEPTNGMPFKAVPIASLPPEAIPDSAPKRRGRPPRDPNAPPVTRKRRSKASLETQIGAMLMTFNFAFMVIPPIRQDALDEAEISALAKAIDQQAKSSPRFRKYLEAMLGATSGGQLVSVCAIIGARRLARHEIGLPKEADEALGSMLSVVTNAPSTIPPEDESDKPDHADDAN